jgi:hypothetical protein
LRLIKCNNTVTMRNIAEIVTELHFFTITCPAVGNRSPVVNHSLQYSKTIIYNKVTHYLKTTVFITAYETNIFFRSSFVSVTERHRLGVFEGNMLRMVRVS